MAFESLRAWVRRHPVRTMVYLLLLAGAGAGLWLARGALAGEQDAFATRVARWPALRDWIERQGIARYQVESVRLGPGDAGCGLRLALRGATFSLLAPGAARVHVDGFQICASLAVAAQGFQFGTDRRPDLLSAAAAAASWPQATLEDLRWNDPGGSPVLAAGALAATLEPLSAQLVRLRILPADSTPLAEIVHASASGLRLSAGSAAVENVQAAGVRALLASESGGWNATRAARQFQAAGLSLLAVADASLAEFRRVLERLRALFLWAALLAGAFVFLLKLLLVRVPPALVWRLAVAALPVLLCLALYGLLWGAVNFAVFALCALLCSVALAAALELALYRRAAQWHQRWEPVVLDLLAPFLILPPLAAYGYPAVVPAALPRPSQVSVAAASLRDATAQVRTSLCGDALEGQTQVAEAALRNLRLQLDPASLGIRGVAFATAQARGETQPGAIPALDRLLFLPAAWKRTPPVAFCVTAAGEGGNPPAECLPAPGSPGAATLSAAAALDLNRLAARLTAAIRTPQLAARLAAGADLAGAELQDLRTLPGSRIAIGGAKGQVSWTSPATARLRLSRLAAPLASSRLSAGLVELGGSLPLTCAAGKTEVHARLDQVGLAAAGGYQATVDSLRFDLRRSAAGEISSESGLRGVRVQGTRPGEAAPWLDAEFPSAEAGLRGRASSGWLPRRFEGAASLSVSHRGGAEALGFSSPLRLAADLWRGELHLPLQAVTLRQSLAAQAPAIPLRLSADARLQSLAGPARAEAQARVEIPRLPLDSPPVRAELNDLSLRASLRTPGPDVQVRFASGWNRVTLPQSPRALDLREVSRLDVTAEGAARGLPSWEALSADLSSLGQWARRNTPAIPAELSFRFAGSLPAEPGAPVFTAETQSGAGVRVDAATTAVQSLSLPDARFAKATIESRSTGVRTSQGAGDLEFAARSTLTDSAAEAAISQPIGGTLHARADHADFTLVGDLALQPLLARLDPFLRQAGVNLDGVSVPARLTALQAAFQFADARWKGFRMEARVAPGPLAVLDFTRMLRPDAPRFLEGMETSAGAPLELRADAPSAAWPQLDVQFHAPSLSVSVNHGAQETSLSAGARAGLTLLDAGAAPSPVSDRLASAAAGFRRQLNQALAVFSPDAPAIDMVRWRAALENAGKPVAVFQPDGLELALNARIGNFTWRTGGRESSLSGSTGLAAWLGLYDGHLIADAEAPVRLSLSLGGRPPSTWDFRLPLLAAIDEHLQPASASSGDLWDSAYYEKLWAGYRPRHAVTSVPWISRRELTFAGLSFQDVVFPSQPFRVALGYAGPLELHAPAAARVLYGRSEGLLQARLNWLDGAVSVDSRVRAALHGLEAGAVGLADAPGHIPFLEDTLEGSLSARTDGMRVDAHFLPRLLSDASTVTELDKLGLEVALRSAGPLAGVMQFNTNLRLKLANQVLNDIARQFQMDAPPSALRYRRMAFQFQVAGGAVQTRPLLLGLEGVTVPGLEPLGLDTAIRVHWGAQRTGFSGSPLPFRNLLGFLERSLAAPPLH